MSDESLIPWTQIEPLLTPGMTWWELGNVLEKQLGMSHEIYGGVVSDAGVRIVKRDDPAFIEQVTRRRGDDPVTFPRGG